MPELSPCPACENPASALAFTCPKCGHPLREAATPGRYRDMQLAAIKHRLSWLILFALVICLLLIDATQ